MDKDEGRVSGGMANPASLYVLSLLSLLTLSVIEPKSAFALRATASASRRPLSEKTVSQESHLILGYLMLPWHNGVPSLEDT